jgi:hypothetical protein
MTTTIWTLLVIFVIAPLGALAFDWSLFGNWIWHIAPEKVRDYEEHSGVTGTTPQTQKNRSSLIGSSPSLVGQGCVSSMA